MVIYVRLQQQPLSTRVTLFYLGSHQANGLGGERLYASTSFFQKKNCDEFSGVHRNPQNYESESGVIAQKDGDKKQITGLVTTRRIATKILEFIVITKKLWK